MSAEEFTLRCMAAFARHCLLLDVDDALAEAAGMEAATP